MATNTNSDPISPGRFPIDRSRPLEVVAHNRNGTISVRGVQRDDILVRAISSDGDDEVESLRIEYADNRLEVRTDHRSQGRDAAREVRRAAREAGRAARDATRAAREATRAATDDIFRRREGQFSKGGLLGSWQIDFDDHIKHELRDLIPFGIGGSVDLVIEIPASGVEARVEAHTTSGEIDVEEIHGVVDVATASGEITLRRVSGDLTVQSASGEIKVTEPTGTLRARSASGEIVVHQGSLEQYVLNTASGDIHLITTLIGAGPYRIDAVSGDVDLILDAPGHILDQGCTIPLKTVSGDLNVSGGARKINRRTWHYGPETGHSIELAIRTVSGDTSVSLARQPERSTAPYGTGPNDATRPIDTVRQASQEQPADPIPPILPVPPLSSVPPLPPTPPTPPPPVLTESGQAMTPTATSQKSEAPSVATGPENKGDALSRLADEMAASMTTENVSTYGYPPERPAQPERSSSQVDSLLAGLLAAVERGEIDIDEAMRRLDRAPNDN